MKRKKEKYPKEFSAILYRFKHGTEDDWIMGSVQGIYRARSKRYWIDMSELGEGPKEHRRIMADEIEWEYLDEVGE